ncbi:MAG: TrkH family potassium uptake protein [bacterium]|jgi:trk system potassium uptake protein TrkH|nr:TrkH family potassium uptake protein [bacterium]
MRNRFQTIHIIFNFLGSLFIVLGGLLLLPLVFVVAGGELEGGMATLWAFVVPSVASFLLGTLLTLVCRRGVPNSVQAMLICCLGWIGFSAIGAIPFVIGIGVSYLDGYFETMSGFTTTGITMLSGLDSMPRSILFWRSLTQWLGGLGIVTFFLAVTFRGGSAHRLFGAESHKIDVGRPVPGIARTLKILWGIYALFTLIIVLGLIGVGMSAFDSVCHSFTALSTGGFSPYDASIEYYRIAGYTHYRWIEYILVLGMILGGTNFLIHYRVLNGNFKALWDNMEMRYWWSGIGIFVAIIVLERYLRLDPVAGLSSAGGGFWKQLEENFRIVLFQVVSILTTTGFGTRDIGTSFFGHTAKQLFLVMMVVGGCVGSTGGGIKVLRIGILMKLIRREVFKLRTPPRAVSTVLIDGTPLHSNEIYRVSGLFFTWIFLLVIGGCITAFLSNLDGLAAASGMFSALGNIGPCYIPVKFMGELHPLIKIVYIFGMLAGRLEILPVLLLFSRKAWQA